MMKQVQDEPPSILAARPDLPAGIERVTAQALAKQLVDRFQAAGALSEAFSRAAQETSAASSSVLAADTVANAPVVVAADDLDEVTVVQPRDEVTVVRPRHEAPAYAQPI